MVISDKNSLKNELDKIKNNLNCNTESCVIEHPQFKKFALQKHIINNHQIEENIKERFKIKGPRNSTDWLSNEDIDNTLQDWACTFEDFFPCEFAMIDFNKTNEPLNQYNMVDVYLGKYSKKTILGEMKTPCRTFGCAINTDKSTGNGIHWMALFVDMRGKDETSPWTIEYYNSAKSKEPQSSIANWMEEKKKELKQLLTVSKKKNKKLKVEICKVDHQMSTTECGLYTLFYIRSRLENIPYSRFLESEIPDESMIMFRKHCFRD